MSATEERERLTTLSLGTPPLELPDPVRDQQGELVAETLTVRDRRDALRLASELDVVLARPLSLERRVLIFRLAAELAAHADEGEADE